MFASLQMGLFLWNGGNNTFRIRVDIKIWEWHSLCGSRSGYNITYLFWEVGSWNFQRMKEQFVGTLEQAEVHLHNKSLVYPQPVSKTLGVCLGLYGSTHYLILHSRVLINPKTHYKWCDIDSKYVVPFLWISEPKNGLLLTLRYKQLLKTSKLGPKCRASAMDNVSWYISESAKSQIASVYNGAHLLYSREARWWDFSCTCRTR